MKTLIKDLVYFSRKFFMNIKSMTIKSTNFCGISFKRQKQHEMAKINELREASSRIYGSSGGVFEGGGLFEGRGVGNVRIYGTPSKKERNLYNHLPRQNHLQKFSDQVQTYQQSSSRAKFVDKPKVKIGRVRSSFPR